MKDFIRREWLYLLMIIGLAVLTFMQITNFRFGFFTAYDEAYFLLKLQEAYDMSCITGKSQWNLIAIDWFPYLDLTSKFYSALAASILMWASTVAVTATSCILFDKKRVIKYFALSWLFLFGIGDSMQYVSMQTAVLTWALCAWILFYKSDIAWKKSVYAAICGVCLGFSLFIIIPAALALLACVTLLIIITHWNEWRKMLLYIGSGVVGVLLTLLYMHVVVCPLGDILDAMLFTATYIGKSGYHYDGASFIMQYALFFRDCLFVILAFVGSYWLSMRISNKWIGSIAYVAMILIYTHYQVKPLISPSMFMMSIPLIPFLFSDLQNFKWSDLKKAETWFYLFLFAYPLIASFGTNTALSGRIHCFVSAWLFLWFEYEYKRPQEDYKRVYAAVLILFAMPLVGTVNTYMNRDDSHHFTRGNKYFAEIALTEKQVDYFNNVYDILEEYNYQPKQSAVLTACYDYCCLYAFEAVNAANYHQVQNFAYFPKEKMIEPDFIFLCKWDSIVMAQDLEAMPWGWPEEFDKYNVGTPEPDGAPWINHPELETRHLYCRKSLKKTL